jgi:hypothetical protein
MPYLIRGVQKSLNFISLFFVPSCLVAELLRFQFFLFPHNNSKLNAIINDGSLTTPRKANQSEKAADSHDVSFILSTKIWSSGLKSKPGPLDPDLYFLRGPGRRFIQGCNGRMGKGQDGNIMNSEGGTLLIGVNDDSGIEGIEAYGFP